MNNGLFEGSMKTGRRIVYQKHPSTRKKDESNDFRPKIVTIWTPFFLSRGQGRWRTARDKYF
jgi:hypothetical protein